MRNIFSFTHCTKNSEVRRDFFQNLTQKDFNNITDNNKLKILLNPETFSPCTVSYIKKSLELRMGDQLFLQLNKLVIFTVEQINAMIFLLMYDTNLFQFHCNKELCNYVKMLKKYNFKINLTIGKNMKF